MLKSAWCIILNISNTVSCEFPIEIVASTYFNELYLDRSIVALLLCSLTAIRMLFRVNPFSLCGCSLRNIISAEMYRNKTQAKPISWIFYIWILYSECQYQQSYCHSNSTIFFNGLIFPTFVKEKKIYERKSYCEKTHFGVFIKSIKL